MNDAHRNRWIAVAIVWVGSILLAFWNLQVIERTATNRQLGEASIANQLFIDGRKADMERVAHEVEKQTQPISSPAFGHLVVQEDLARLAKQCGLTELKVDGEAGEGTGGEFPLTVSFKGVLSGAARWLEIVKTDYPYLVVRSFEAKGASLESSASFTVQLNYRYRAAASQES